jgi:serine phosphatase RsbU (regulator of sigma subunit)
MLGITQLNEIYIHDENCPPDKALGIMRKQVIDSLSQNISEYGSKDGMDMLLGILHKETLKFEFASANQAMYLMRDGNLSLFKGDKMPVGIYRRMEPFTLNQIQLLKGDIIYLFTDGVVDLFGGNNDRRLYLKGLQDILLQVYNEKLVNQAKLIEKYLMDWQGNNKQTDDMLMIGLRI